jgi:hypothetical protein
MMRCFFIREGVVVIAKDLVGVSDQEEAVSIGVSIFAETGPYDGFEIWKGSKRVHKAGRVSRKRKNGVRRLVNFE